MRSEVTSLRPRIRPFDDAVDAFRAGAAADCVAIAHGHISVAAALLRTRAYLRLGDVDRAVDSLETLDPASFASCVERAEYYLLTAAAHIRSRAFDDARAALDVARVYAFAAPCSAVEAEYHFYESLFEIACRNFDAAVVRADEALGVSVGRFERGTYFVPLAISKARAYTSRGAAAGARERYRDQLADIRCGLAMHATASDDTYVHASLLMQFSFHVRDFDLVEDAAWLRRQDVSGWPDDLRPMQFEIHRSLGWSAALAGDHLGAFRDFRRSAECAPNTARRIWAIADRAFLGRELGEVHLVREEVEHAWELASQVDWNRSAGEDRFGLVLLARELAPFCADRAAAILERYRRIGAKLAPALLNNVDRRPRAYEALAEGHVLVRDRPSDACRRFRDAFEVWDALGYRWLAATAAVELAELGAGDEFAQYARRESRMRPGSWLARRVARAATTV